MAADLVDQEELEGLVGPVDLDDVLGEVALVLHPQGQRGEVRVAGAHVVGQPQGGGGGGGGGGLARGLGVQALVRVVDAVAAGQMGTEETAQ